MANFSIGVVGLDALGAALTRRLDQQGIGHTATDLNSRLVQAHLADGGSAPAGSPFDLAQICNLIFLAETSDASLREAVLGSVGLVHLLRPGTIIVDMSDASPNTGPALARALQSKGAIWIEATPVGGAREASEGTLTLLTSGPAETLEQVAPVLRTFASRTLRLGELGSGPLAKALVAAFGALSTAAYAELLIVAKKSGLEAAGILDALPFLDPGAGTPPREVAEEVLSGRYQSGIPSKRMREDVARVFDAARAVDAPAALTGWLLSAYVSAGHAQAASGDHLDVIRWMADNAGTSFGSTEGAW